jgi:hypothetical protein
LRYFTLALFIEYVVFGTWLYFWLIKL